MARGRKEGSEGRSTWLKRKGYREIMKKKDTRVEMESEKKGKRGEDTGIEME